MKELVLKQGKNSGCLSSTKWSLAKFACHFLHVQPIPNLSTDCNLKKSRLLYIIQHKLYCYKFFSHYIIFYSAYSFINSFRWIRLNNKHFTSILYTVPSFFIFVGVEIFIFSEHFYTTHTHAASSSNHIIVVSLIYRCVEPVIL